MRNQWTEKGISLSKLADFVRDFFLNRDFTAVVDQISGVYRVLAKTNFYVRKAKLGITVEISGTPDNFFVDFRTAIDTKTPLRTSSLTTLFGGGGLVLRDFQMQEKFDMLERDFWSYLSQVIADLAAPVQ